MFNKTFELSLTKNYVAHWSMPHAIRELIQNAIDSDSPFIYEWIKEEDTVALRLNSEFTVLQPQTLLLGSTTKAEATDKIGSFGEGYKIALLVLTREGYGVEMRNGDKLWKPRFKFSRLFNEEQLVVDEEPLTMKNKGLTFIVHGIDASGQEAIEQSCLMMQNNIGRIRQTKYGEILFDREKKLYVGGLYICDIDLKYGYNIKPEYITLERDRQSVSSWDLKDISLKMWFDIDEPATVAEMIDNQLPDVEYARYDCPEIVKEACYQLFRERNPGAIVAENQSELKSLVARGMEKVVVVGSAMYHAVSTSKSYRSGVPERKLVVMPRARMAIWLADNRSEMRSKSIIAFKKLMEEATNWRSH